MIIKSLPKINLALDILGKTQSGYHEIQTVFHQLSGPADEIKLQPAEEILIESDEPRLPLDKTNIVLKAALLLKKLCGIDQGAGIFIRKKIPLMSGLGGGASNAVAALKGLAKLWGVFCCGNPDTHGEKKCILRKIADQIGMDCAFFFAGGAALGEHFGEKITSLPRLPDDIKIEVIETGVEVSSYKAYSQIDLDNKCGRNTEKTRVLINALNKKDAEAILENIHNDFEETVFKKYPVLKQIKDKVESEKPGRVLLCGSGGALARLFIVH